MMSVIAPESDRPFAPRTSAHRRSSSNVEVRPPRYSLLEGALPIISPSTIAPPQAETTTSVETEAASRRPPRYSTVFNRARADRDRRHRTRPSGANRSHASSGPQLHEYHLRNGSNSRAEPYATLRVYSRSSAAASSSVTSSGSSGSAPSSIRIPKYCGAQLIQGSLDLNLEVPQNINSISLILRGRIITNSYDSGTYTFLQHPITSWTRANGDPRAMILALITDPNDGSDNTGLRVKKFEGKLSGSYSWPFSFPFPQEVKLVPPHGTEGCMSPLPQTFSGKSSKASVQYELVLRMTHGILRSDSKLNTPVIYLPDITPPSSSILRQIAYGENLSTPGPDVDPTGWHPLPPTTVRGKLYMERNIKLQCTVSIASPLSYTRGTVIPCHISIESSDAHTLDVLATPKTIVLRLVRTIHYYDETAQSTSTQGKQRANGSCDRPSANLVEEVKVINQAVWWVNEQGIDSQGANRRQLEGEIHLDKELQPSCTFSLFKVSYAIELLPFATPVFQLIKGSGSGTSSPVNSASRKAPETVLVSYPITIATLHGEGPAPVTYTKPKPRPTKRTQTGTNFNPSAMLSTVGGGLGFQF